MKSVKTTLKRKIYVKNKLGRAMKNGYVKDKHQSKNNSTTIDSIPTSEDSLCAC